MVVIEVAKQEVEKWLDYKKVSPKKRESYADNIDALAESISEGFLVLTENFEFELTLKFPFGTDVKTEKLTFKPRLAVGEAQNYLQGVKATDIDGRMLAYVAALTVKPKELIKKLDTDDFSVCQNIVLFFVG